MNNASAYKQALADVEEYGMMMGWVHEGTDIPDLFQTLTNMSQLDDDGCLEEAVRVRPLVMPVIGKALTMKEDNYSLNMYACCRH